MKKREQIQQPEKMPICSIQRLLVSKVGGCYLCSKHDDPFVWVIKSRDEYRRMEIRFCQKCLDEINTSIGGTT